MEAVFIKILNMSWTAAWMVLAVVLFRLIFKKAPKGIVCVLWGLVALRLLIPFSFESVLSLIPNTAPISENIMLDATPSIESGIGSLDESVNSVLAEHFTAEPLASANPMQILMFIGTLIWLAGIICFLIYGLISFLVLKHKVRASIKIEKNIKMCDHISSPFILGIIRPIIYLPSDIGEEQLEHVLLHEKAHIKRKDHWWKPLGFLLLAVHWFNPLIWLAYLLLCRDIEYACDERVIKKMDIDGIKRYSATLLNCSISRRSLTMCPLAFGEVGVKQRIKSVLSFKKPTIWIIIIAVLVSIVLCVTLLTDPKTQGDNYDLWVIEGEKGEIAAFTHTGKNSIYFYGVSEVKVKVDGAYLDLSDAIDRDEYLIDKLITQAQEECEIIKNDESGSVLYRHDDYAILKFDLKVSVLGVGQESRDTLDYTYDGGIYFGMPDMTIDEIETLWANRKIPWNDPEMLTINLGVSDSKPLSILYGGKDASGQDAADVVEKYYDVLKKQGYSDGLEPYEEFCSDSLNAKNKNAVVQDITLLEFSHCEIVSSAFLGESDYDHLKEIADDCYACCYVQTSDKILCNEDGAFGSKGEEVNRCYSYFLVRDGKQSDWKIYDCGYPNFYDPGVSIKEYELKIKQSNDLTLTKVTTPKLKDAYGFDIYYCGLERVEVFYKGEYVNLADVIDNAEIIDGILSLAKDGVERGNGDYYKDGGSMVYFADNFTIIKMHSLTLDADRYDETMYIGPAQMSLSDVQNYH